MSGNPTVDGVLRRYLLGTIDPDVREDVERRLFSDDRIFWEQLCLIEDELIDDYVGGALDDDERQSFERCFLATEERREKLGFARALKAHAERESQRKRSGFLALFFDRYVSMPAWAPAAAALLLIVLPGLAWQAARSGGAREVSAWLSSGLVRSVGTELQRIQVPAGASLVRLRLETDGREFPSYRATLHAAGGEEIWSQRNLNATEIDGRPAVALTLPAELVPEGDYFVRLQGVPPQKEPVALNRYDFRVLR